jgi:hypothetical protein
MFFNDYMKKWMLLVLIILLIPFVIAEEDFFGEGSWNPIEVSTNEGNVPTNFEYYETDSDGNSVINMNLAQEDDSYYNFDYANENTNWETNQGTISLFSMTNALFSLGSLIQGSFISFENNNNIYIKSIFDSSEITATINKDGILEVGQINGIGEMGKVVIEIENGNLTQDNNIVFIPSGNNPEYIYYNTTEIEFKDGNITYLGETVTNNDDSKDKSSVNFDETGFTKVKLLQNDIYENFDYGIKNKGDTEYICKNNALCDVNIENSIFTIRGENDLLYKDETVYSSESENNIFTIDTATGESSLTNTKPRGKLASMCTGYHLLSQEEVLHSVILEEPCHEQIKYYEYNDYKVHLDDDVLYVNNYVVFPQGSSQWDALMEVLNA